MWKKILPKQEPVEEKYEIELDGVCIRVGQSTSSPGELWQWFMFSFGEHTKADFAEAMETWPKEAIKIARAQLDALEAKMLENVPS